MLRRYYELLDTGPVGLGHRRRSHLEQKVRGLPLWDLLGVLYRRYLFW